MNDKHDVDALCLEVFAGISAIATHDLKNTLAIINENAGLLDDLASMVDENDGVPTDRVKAAAAKVALQVARSNTIIKNLNRFAHSGDTPVARASVQDLLELMVALTGRKAAMNSLCVTVEGGKEHQVETSLFHLEALLYRILLHIYSAAVPGSSLVLSPGQDGTCLAISFKVDLRTDSDGASFPGSKEQALLDDLAGSLEVHKQEIILKISSPPLS